jgi:hypothetical protein
MHDVAEMVKRCVRCEEAKPLDAFPNAPRMVDGKHSYCRSCMNAYRREWERNRNPEQRARRRANARRQYAARRTERVIASRMRHRASSGAVKRNRKGTVEPYEPVSAKDAIPAAPFATWIVEMFPGWTLGEVAGLLAVPERRLREVVEYGTERITLDLVDRALTIGLGRPDLLNTLYPVEAAA